MSKSSVFLIGMMGAGKSTVGRCLAKTLKYKFLDTDQLIEGKKRELSIPFLKKMEKVIFEILKEI